ADDALRGPRSAGPQGRAAHDGGAPRSHDRPLDAVARAGGLRAGQAMRLTPMYLQARTRSASTHTRRDTTGRRVRLDRQAPLHLMRGMRIVTKGTYDG